jgi:hypothetical protein
MRFYSVDTAFFTTKREAAAAARHAAKTSYHTVEVDLVDVRADRATLLRLLNDEGGFVNTLKRAVYVAAAKLERGKDDV